MGNCDSEILIFFTSEDYHADMCGIYGAGSNQFLDPEILAKLTILGKALQHRGPDANSNIIEKNFLLGFNRLAIVDLENGMQPFFNASKKIIATVNGEIYNYLELRQELIGLGVNLETKSDIEIIPYLFELYGDDFVLKLRGMFAISIIDKRTNELKLFVDRLGEKPLYWYMNDGMFFYSSEVLPLLESGITKMCIDTDQLPCFIKYGFVLDPFTIIKDVYRVNAGTYVTFSLIDNSLKQSRYWCLSDVNEPLVNPVTTLKSNFKVLAKSICQGEVKMGVALSGGTDSKLVAKLATSTGTKIEAISLGYSEKSRHDETLEAAKSARELDIKSHVCLISSSQAARLFREVCSAIDEPVADIASINYLALFEFAHRLNIKVVLMGHGSDELLMAYDWLNNAVHRAKVRKSTLEGNFRLTSYLQLIQNPFSNSGLKNLLRMFAVSRENVFTLRQAIRDFYDSKKGNKTIDFYDLSPNHMAKSKFSSKLTVRMKLDVQNLRNLSVGDCSRDLTSAARNQIVGDYLRLNGLLQIDKLSMSRSIEVRNPLVDFKLVETILRADWNSLKVPSKALLRAADNVIVQKIRKPLLKRGFSPPVRPWFRSLMSCYRAELQNPRSIDLGLFPKNWSRHFTRPFTWYGRKSAIWFELLTLELWIRETEKRVGKNFF